MNIDCLFAQDEERTPARSDRAHQADRRWMGEDKASDLGWDRESEWEWEWETRIRTLRRTSTHNNHPVLHTHTHAHTQENTHTWFVGKKRQAAWKSVDEVNWCCWLSRRFTWLKCLAGPTHTRVCIRKVCVCVCLLVVCVCVWSWMIMFQC